jgi:5-amino-6-(5-phosphoribosylamino)uracil reductase
MRFTRLTPDPGPLELEEQLARLALGDKAPEDRPYTVANFVASADGHATFAGRSGQLGDDGDKAVFHGLREQVDAVFAGTKTLQTENYGRILGKSERRERRERYGLTAEPLACVVSRSGAIPMAVPLFNDPEARIVVFTPADAAPDITGCGAEITLVELDPAELTLTTALATLRRDFGVRSLLCEGGPTVFAALVREQLVDELWLTLAPKLTGGGTGPAVTNGPELPEPHELRLIWALERERSLFLRYGLT